MLRLLKRFLKGLWQRRRWTALGGCLFVVLFSLGLTPQLAPWRYTLWATLAFGVTIAAITYLAIIVYQNVASLWAELRGLRQEVAARDQRTRDDYAQLSHLFESVQDGLYDQAQGISDDLPNPIEVESGRHLFGDLEKGLFSALPRLRPKLIMDVGASVGLQTRTLLKRCPDAFAIAFEPFPGN